MTTRRPDQVVVLHAAGAGGGHRRPGTGPARTGRMFGVELWNNPSCSKCAAARSTLDEARVPYRLRAYLDEPPTAAELAEVLRRLGAQPWEICRTGEPAARLLGMGEWPRDADCAPRWVAAMVEHPELIQRPILLLDDGHAVVARTPEALSEAVHREAVPRRSGS